MTTTYKKCCLIFLAALLLFVAGHFLIWKTVTEAFLTGKYDGGDLSRMGYILGSKLYRHNYDDLPRHHVELEGDDTFRKVDILTFGDSFSAGGGGGRNRFYQDYIATINTMEVGNCRPFTSLNFLTSLAILANNGYLDRVKPRYIILSSSEKLCIERFSGPADFNRTMPLQELFALKRLRYDQGMREVRFINNGNLNYLEFSLLYHFSPNAVFSNTYQLKLVQDMFTVPNSNMLLFYKNDMKSIRHGTEKNIRTLNDNMNKMADLLARKGIRLYFMPCVNKYDLYRGYIVDNTYPKGTFFEQLRLLPKRYTLIDTKGILLEELKRGEKNVFYPDDSHWSWKASQRIFETVRFEK